MAEKKVKGRKTSARYPKGYTGPTDTDVVIERPPRKPPKPPRGPKATNGGGKGSVGSSNGKRPATPKGKKDPGGFKSPGFKSEGFTGRAKEKKPRSGQSPPSVREKERKGGPPSQRPTSPGKKKLPKSMYAPSPFPGKPKGKPKGVPIYPRPEPKPRPKGVPIYPKPIKPPRKPGTKVMTPMKKKGPSKKAPTKRKK